jgi:hypothetical protein
LKILQHRQGDPQWIEARRGVITASEVAAFMLEGRKCRLKKEKLHEILIAQGISFKKSATNDELVSLLPDPTPYLTLSDAAQKYICEKLTETMENDEFEQEAYDKEQRFFDNDPWIRRGKEYEGMARDWLAKKLDRQIVETGLILHDCEKFGASPDGLILSECGNNYEEGCEIKNHKREIHLALLLAGGLPDIHRFPCHTGMAVTGLKRWHFVSYHHSLPKLHVVVEWDEFTQQVHDGLLAFVDEMEAVRVRLSQMWREEFQND